MPLFIGDGTETEVFVEAEDFSWPSWLRERVGIGTQRVLQALCLFGPASKDTHSTSSQASHLY